MPIRVTNQMISHRTLQNLWASMGRMDRWNQQLSTGRRISTPKDDPSGTEAAMRLRTTIQAAEQYVRNVDDAISWLEATDAALDQVTKVMQRARELVIYGGNGSMPDDSREALAQEMDQLLRDLINVANSKHGQRHLFAGENTLLKPFEAVYADPTDPDSEILSVVYHGTSYAPADGFFGLDVEIEAGITLRYNLHGDDVFDPIFQAMIGALESLRNGDLDDCSQPPILITWTTRWRTSCGGAPRQGPVPTASSWCGIASSTIRSTWKSSQLKLKASTSPRSS